VNDDIVARETEILGHPPRIPALTSAEAVRAGQQRTAQLSEAVTGFPASPADMTVPEMLLAMLRHADLYDHLAGLSVQLIARGALTARDRELVVLRAAWLCQAPYEFGEHVRLAKGLAGLRADEIDGVVVGSTALAWSEHERAVLRATEDLHERSMVADETWNILARTYDDQQLIELPVLAGQATMVAYMQNACRFRLAPANKGLRAR